ncbi:MAG: 1-(5-phosphoribosyl)-5-[(5-phosphoribosylamino)methylideneamino]imidazole-4-carboxamide isomerase [Bacillota bacterium]
MSRILVIPALDLRRGRCVRLYQGQPDRETVYSDDPVEVALQWEKLGARLLHIVDLDGAFSGRSGNEGVVAAIGGALKIPFQLGGGIRTRDGVQKALAAGASRVILGTVAVEQPLLTLELVKEYGERIVVGVDARDGQAAVKGWLEDSTMPVLELARRVEQMGVAEIIYTAISRDGTLHGPDLTGLDELLEATGLHVIMSGGISSKEDLLALKPFAGRVKGVIIGQALYSNRLTLQEAMQVLE